MGLTGVKLEATGGICITKSFWNFYSLPNIFRVVKSRTVWWAQHVSRGVKRKIHVGNWWGNLEKKGHLEEIDVNEIIILK